MMMLVCLVFGILCGAATIVSGNCMFAAIIHGVFNLIGEVPVFLSVSQRNTLLGLIPPACWECSGCLSARCLFLSA